MVEYPGFEPGMPEAAGLQSAGLPVTQILHEIDFGGDGWSRTNVEFPHRLTAGRMAVMLHHPKINLF